MSSRRTVTTVTVEIDGEVIARFANGEDATFFARTANEAGLFSLSHPGREAHAYDRRGAMLCCPLSHTTA